MTGCMADWCAQHGDDPDPYCSNCPNGLAALFQLNRAERAEAEVEELRDLVLSLWSYAQLQRIEAHAEYGDLYAQSLVNLVQSEISSWKEDQ